MGSPCAPLPRAVARGTALLVAGTLGLVGCRGGPPPAPGPAEPDCVVARIVDGDSLTCSDGERVRLLLVDAPERGQAPHGASAAAALVDLAPPGTPLRVELDRQPRDRYGRMLAYLWLPDGRLLNEEIVRAGFAVDLVYAPNRRYLKKILDAQAEARAARAGLWAGWGFACLPVDYRARRCGR